MRRCIVIATLICLFISHSFGQLYPFVNYTPRNGLVNNRVRRIYQDSNGKLYFATFGGLSVNDGQRFTSYTTSNGLAASLVNDIVELGNDSLLVVPNAYKLHLLVHGKLKDVPLCENYCPCINQLLKCGKNHSYYGLADEGLFRFESNKFTRIVLNNLPVKDVKNLCHATEANDYLFINTDVKTPVYPQPSLFFAYNTISGKVIWSGNIPTVTYSLRTPKNEILVSTSTGIYAVSKEALKRGKIQLTDPPSSYHIPKGLISEYMYFDRSENLWLTTSRGLLKLNRGGGVQSFSTENGLPGNVFCFIFQDRENSMWFATEQKGVVKYAGRNVALFPAFNNRIRASDVCASPNSDSVWFYDAGSNNIWLSHSNLFEKFAAVHPQRFSYCLIQGKGSYMIEAFNLYRLCFLPGHRFSSRLLYSDSLQKMGYTGSIDKEGNLIATAGNMVAALRSNRVVKEPLEYFAGPPAFAHSDSMWVVTRTGQLYLYKLRPSSPLHYFQLLQVYHKELSGIDPRSITCDRKGNIWIGTRNHGLFCFTTCNHQLKLKLQFGVKDGLTDDFIQCLYCDSSNQIWAGNPQGLDKIMLKDDQYFIENVTRSFNIYPDIRKIASDKGGTIWALSSHGIVKIAPSGPDPHEFIPGLLFTRIKAGNKELPPDSPSDPLPHFQHDLFFQVSVPSFRDEDNVRFRFKLNGREEGSWSNASSLAEINYVHLPPGKYTLIAEAYFVNGLYPTQRSVYSFGIRAPWWTAWWFVCLEVLAAACFIFLIARIYFNSQLQKQRLALEKKQAIQRERTRIATDMHDDFGAALSRIKFLGEILKLKNQSGKVLSEDLNKIIAYSDDMIEKMGEIVWALNERNDSLKDLLSFTRSYAVEYLTQNQLQCSIHSADNFPEISLRGEVRRNIFLSMKEILHNVVKHSGAGSVEIWIGFDKSLLIIIKDDGSGIDFSKFRRNSNGLENIRKRMSDIGGSARFINKEGTTVELTVPLGI